MTTATRTDPAPATSTTTGPADVAHYVARAGLTDAAILGTPVEALCGEWFTPNRDPNRRPVCPPCRDVYEGLPA